MVENGGGVVVEAGGAALEEAGDDDELVLADDLAEGGGGGAGDGLGDGEEGVVFALAEVLGAEELGQADELGAGLRRLRARGRRPWRGWPRWSGSQDIWMRATRVVLVCRHDFPYG